MEGTNLSDVIFDEGSMQGTQIGCCGKNGGSNNNCTPARALNASFAAVDFSRNQMGRIRLAQTGPEGQPHGWRKS